MNELDEAIKDTEADLAMAETVLQQRREEYRAAEERLAEAHTKHSAMQKQLAELLRAW